MNCILENDSILLFPIVRYYHYPTVVVVMYDLIKVTKDDRLIVSNGIVELL